MGGEIRVLHVDDEPDFAALTADVLEKRDDRFKFVTETRAADALERLEDGQGVDCLVSDYQMPGMDGLVLLEAVRERDEDLPFILFTGQGSEEVASAALSAGATEYLQKRPGTEQFDLLANRIVNAVESYRAQKRVADLEEVRETLHDVNQALVRADSRDEVEAAVCDILTQLKRVRCVVISDVDPESGRLSPRAWAGEAEAFPVDVELTLDSAPGSSQTPYERAVAERSVAASGDIQADPAFDPWREAVTKSGHRAAAVIPLSHDGIHYGLLELYGSRERDPDEMPTDILAELGDDIGHALGALKTRADLEASEARHRILTESVSDAIVTIDASSTITYANPATEALFGYTSEELEGESLTTLMPERLREAHREGIDRYRRTGERTLDWTGVELPGETADGTEISLAISFGEFERRGERYFTGVIRDVTERAEHEKELKRQNEFLDEFAGIVAHDLQNPLTTATGHLELAREDVEDEHLEVAARTLGRMQDLVEDLLKLARQGQDVEEIQPVSLAEVVALASATVTDTVTVETDPSLGSLKGHRKRVRVLLENLFRNAEEHGGPDVHIRITRIDGGFAVEDDGPGIPENVRDEVFEPGFSTKDGGTGFGLNIVGKIVDAHGWEIGVADGVDGGTCFEITGVERSS